METKYPMLLVLDPAVKVMKTRSHVHLNRTGKNSMKQEWIPQWFS